MAGTDWVDLIEARANQATPGPWRSYIEGRDHMAGSSFIMTGGADIELAGATQADQDFIAHARQDIARLIEEVRRLRQCQPPDIASESDEIPSAP